MTKKSRFLIEEEREVEEFDWEKFRQEKQQIKDSVKVLSHTFNQPCRYKVEISTRLLILEKEMSHTQTECVWQLSPLSNFCIELSVLDKKYLKLDRQMKPLIDFVEKVNKAIDHLQLELNMDNTVKKVLRDDKIQKKWEQIKFEELKPYELENPSFKAIIEAYDKEFGSLTSSIHQNILYQLFFYPSGRIKYPNPQSTCLSTGNTTPSQLFAGKKIPYDLYCKSFIEGEYIQVRYASFPPDRWDMFPLKESYVKDYQELTGQEFDYKFRIEGRYEYTRDYVWEKARIYVKEQASEGLLYISEYTFTRITEEEKTEKP